MTRNGSDRDGRAVAKRIQSTFEHHLPDLALRHQAHWALRLFRVTGKKKYLSPLLAHLESSVPATLQHISLLGERAAFHAAAQEAFFGYCKRNRWRTYRTRLYKKDPELLLMRGLLQSMYLWHALGLHVSPLLRPAYMRAMKALRAYPFRAKLLRAPLLAHDAAQVVNAAYALYFLGIIDMRDACEKAFRTWFSEKPERSIRMSDKLYGLTHFVIAASDYYQAFLPRAAFPWIFSYFDAHIDRLVRTTPTDILAEIGLCYLLARRDTPAVRAKIIRELRKRFNTRCGFIPYSGRRERYSLHYAEHSNVVAYLFLKRPHRFFRGPHLSQKNSDFFATPRQKSKKLI